MTDIKLFRLGEAGATELAGAGAQVEKSLQNLFETNLEALLGIRFLASEYTTGPVHGGRIDTLGIDEDGSPVIIEYKRALNENVINQGLFYLDWLLDHRREFQWLVMDVLGREAADAVEWSSPRLLCVAGDFTRYDGHAVKQIARSIELLMVELVHAPQAAGRSGGTPRAAVAAPGTTPVAVPDDRDNGISSATGNGPGLGSVAKESRRSDLIAYRLQDAAPALRDVWEAAAANLQALGDDVQVKELKLYHAFKRLKNFACLEIYPVARTVLAYLKLDPSTVDIEPGFTRDMRGIGHFGTGDLEVTVRTLEDVTKAQPLFQRAYDQG